MKTFPALVCLLFASTVGCGQQNPPSSPAPTAEKSPPPAPAPAAKPAQPAAPVAAESGGEGSAETIDETPPAQDDSNIHLAEALSPAKPASDSRWKEGVNYKLLTPAQPTDVAAGKVEVVEVFWYGCSHCYGLEPFIENWSGKKPGYIQFTRVPVVWGPVHLAHARLFYTLQALGRQDLHSAVFRETQIAGNMLATPDAAESERLQTAFAKQHGIKEADFSQAYRSSDVNAKVQRAHELTRRYRVEGVPLAVINGKYTADIGSAGAPAQFIELINDLAAREHQKQ